MKKKILFYIIALFILSANLVHAQNYSDRLIIDQRFDEVSVRHISEAQLLYSYVKTYKDNINALYSQYSNSNGPMMDDANTILTDMLAALRKIQTEDVDPEQVESIMLNIVADIKTLNSYIEIYLKDKKKLYEEKLNQIKKSYTSLGNRLSPALDTFIEKLSLILTQKQHLSSKERRIVESLIKIRTENTKIKQFKNLSFASELEMQLYFKGIISNLRKEMFNIQEAAR